MKSLLFIFFENLLNGQTGCLDCLGGCGADRSRKGVLKFIVDEIGSKVPISIMPQYHPKPEIMLHPKSDRIFTQKECNEVLYEMGSHDLQNRWVQQMTVINHYLLDFKKEYSFKNTKYPVSA